MISETARKLTPAVMRRPATILATPITATAIASRARAVDLESTCQNHSTFLREAT